MNPLLTLILKTGQSQLGERLKETSKDFVEAVRNVGETDLTKAQLRKLKGEIREIRPKTEEQKRIEQLAGRKMTPGQLGRRAGLGIGAGILAHGIGATARHAGKGTLRAELLNPRALAASTAIGALYGAAVPVLTRVADIESAKRGAF